MLARTIALAAGLMMAASQLAVAADKFHPIEKMCIWYRTDGQLMKGNSVRCHRKFGLEWFEIQEMEIGMAGIVQKQNTHNIGIRDKLYAIDTITKSGTESVNPMFAPMQQAISRHGSSPEAMGKAFISAMQFRPTDKTKTIAEHRCTVYVSPAVGHACLGESGALMLEQSVMGNVQTATRVAIGEDGGDDNYTLYQRVDLRQGIDLSKGLNLQDLMRQGGGASSQGGAPQMPAGVQDLIKQLQNQ